MSKTNREESFVVVIPESYVVTQADLLAVPRQAVKFRLLAIEDSLHLKKFVIFHQNSQIGDFEFSQHGQIGCEVRMGQKNVLVYFLAIQDKETLTVILFASASVNKVIFTI